MSELPLRKIVRGIIFDDSGVESLFLLLFAKKGYWQNPQGGIDDNESEEKALRREVHEETGISDAEILAHTRVTKTYQTERKGQNILAEVVAFAVRTREREITIGEVENHSSYQWVSYHQALKLLTKYPEQIEIFQNVCQRAGLVSMLNPSGMPSIITPEQLFQTIEKENPSFDLDMIKLAYEFASRAHAGQKRATGEDYITHPLAVAKRLAEEHLDQATVIAGLLHDVPEDTSVTIEQVEKEFGSEVAGIVNGVTKLGTLKYRGIERYAENLRKMFVAMAEDLRVVFVKFADRLHNLKTLGSLPAVKQKRIASETLEIYAPIANRLGMGVWKGELEDLAFPYVYPEEYAWIADTAGKVIDQRKQYVEQMRPKLEALLINEGIKNFTAQSRVKHLFSLWKKITRPQYERDINRIYDLVASRIVVPSVQDCYHALGVIHATYKPLPGRFKDYVAQPKPNGYQSLHTTVFMDDGVIVEIQIRTKEMHDHAEHGVAAHFHYDEAAKVMREKGERTAVASVTGDKQEWLQKLAEWQKEFTDDQAFLDSLKLDIFKNRIFVFTPAGDVIDLPEDATPVDFAYHIHTDLGHHCSGARINNELKSLDTTLKSGDVVEIITDKNKKGPTEGWINIARTHMAREHIKQYVSKKRRGLLAKLFSKKAD